LRPSRFGAIAGFVLVALVFIYTYALFIVIGAELTSLLAVEYAHEHTQTHAAGCGGSSGGKRGLGHGRGATPTPTPPRPTPSSPTSSAPTPAPPEVSVPRLEKQRWRRLVHAGAAAVRHRIGNDTRNGNGRTPQPPRGAGPATGAS
jgi:hypothetical protein